MVSVHCLQIVNFYELNLVIWPNVHHTFCSTHIKLSVKSVHLEVIHSDQLTIIHTTKEDF